MTDFTRIMVALDFSEMDEVLIKYTSFLSEILNPKKIYFINIQKEPDLPAELMAEHKPMDEVYEEKMRAEVIRFFSRVSSIEMDYDVVIGDPLKELVRWTKVKEIDLVIAGRKKSLKGTGMVVSHLTRNISSSLLLVPQEAKHQLKTFFVPTDFSEHAEMASKVMDSLCSKSKGTKNYLQHVFVLPTGFYMTGKSPEEVTEIMKGHAKKKAEEFCSHVDFKTTPEILYSLDDNSDPTDKIMDEAHNKHADIIIIGARGRTNTTSFLLGSVTEKLIARDEDIPLMIVKQREKSFDFFELIKTI